ncbi:MAG: bifunctional hydroxymethylpyrimidine kinase/phosphomethylpyrimidine kinase [Ancrocorticia sp.]
MVNFAYTIAGSEATGGAGFQVDLKTFQHLGVYGMGTLTCIVSFDPKNNWGHRFVPVDPQVIRDQMEAAMSSQDLDTVKIGMLGHPDTIDAVAEGLTSQSWTNVVLDPVLICKGQEPGAALDTDNALREKILPLATVATPNYFEACTLAGMEKLETVQDLAEAAERISKLGPRYVVVKGGIDFPGEEAVDVLWDGENATAFSSPKIGEHRVSGAGCTLAAAITAELAKGTEIYDAVRIAKDVVTDGIRARVPGHTPFDTVWQGAYVPPLPTPEKKGTVISASLASSAAEAAESQGSGCGCGNDGCSK